MESDARLWLLSAVVVAVLMSLDGCDAACDYAGAQALTPTDDALTHDMSDGDAPKAEGETIIFTCDNSNHEYMDPDPGNGQYPITCSSGDFQPPVSPNTWPFCVKKCLIPSPEAGFKPHANEGDLILGGDSVTFECSNANAYIEGSATDQSVMLTCPDATGIMPVGWGTCEMRCAIPAPQAGYDAHPNQGDLVVYDTEIEFLCTGDHKYVGDTTSSGVTVTCSAASGSFTPPTWGTCITKCSVPDPEDGKGYSPQSDTDAKYTVGLQLTYTCANPNGYRAGTTDHTLTIDCLDTGLFQAGWDACENKCTVPDAPENGGYTQYDQSALIDPGTTIRFMCTESYTFAGVAPAATGWDLLCSDEGTFPSTTWPTCEVQCLAPDAPATYDGTDVAGNYYAEGDTATYSCATAGHYIGDTTDREKTVTCGADGQFTPATSEWETCSMRCLIPDAPDGYAAQSDTTPLSPDADPPTKTYVCENQYATIGEAMATENVITCGSDGQFTPSVDTFEECAVRCARPDPKAGYSPLPDAIGVKNQGQKVTFSCETDGETVGITLSPDLTLECGETGEYPPQADWDDCAVKCPVPEPEAGYSAQPDGTDPVDDGDDLVFSCSTNGHTVGTTLLSTHTITCGADGTFPTGWPTCSQKCTIPSPEAGYMAQSDTTPVEVDTVINFQCETTGAKVGDTFSNLHPVACKPDGTFPTDWPTCSVRCVPPLGGPGYNSQPAGTDTVAPGETLVYTCMERGQLSGTSDSNENTLTCGDDGEFPNSWPTCEVRCLVMDAPSGYSAADTDLGSVGMGESISYPCAENLAEAGSTKSTSYTVQCNSLGEFPPPSDWPTCSVPANCPAAPDPWENTTLALADAGQAAGIQAFRHLVYTCPTDAETTDEGDEFLVLCQPDGTYAAPSVWPVCRDKADCSAAEPPEPTLESGLANTTSDDPVREGDQVVYECKEDGWTIRGQGEADSFTLTCNSEGGFGDFSWPECVDPMEVFDMETDSRECHCAGSIDKVKARFLRDNYCRDTTLPGNDRCHGSVVSVSGKRCGTYDLEDPQAEDLCFCDSPLEQSRNIFYFTLQLGENDQPYQWTMDDDGNSPLADPKSEYFRTKAASLEKAIDDLIEETAMGDQAFVGTRVFRFRKGPEVPHGVFPANKPDPADAEAESESESESETVTCAESLLDGVSVPAHLSRVGTGDVDAGSTAVYKCAGDQEVLMTAADDTGRYVAGQTVSLTCATAGDAFEGAPDPWPVCTDASAATCAVPAPDGSKNFNADPNGGAPTGDINMGDSLTYACANGGDEVGDTESAELTVNCVSATHDASPYYKLEWDQEFADWPTCATPAKRKKREDVSAGSGYNYILIDLSTQFLEAGQPTAADFAAFLETLDNGVDGQLGTVFLDPACDPEVCGLREFPDTCSNQFFEDLPDGYAALTPYGYYMSPTDPADVDAGLLLEMGQIAELRCTSTDPVQIPRRDEWDHDPEDWKLTVYCIPPETEGQDGTWSVSEVPPCASVCAEYLPEASLDSDLALVSVVAYNDPDHPVPFAELNTTDSYLLAGDKLWYECRTAFWGLNGGVDTFHDVFGCTVDGMLDTPAPGEDWPFCSPQTDMIVLAVELMLDRYDRAISDRYKLIDFREEDNENETAGLTDYFVTVSVPVMCSLMFFICCCCYCSRDNSPCCRLCHSQTKA